MAWQTVINSQLVTPHSPMLKYPIQRATQCRLKHCGFFAILIAPMANIKHEKKLFSLAVYSADHRHHLNHSVDTLSIQLKLARWCWQKKNSKSNRCLLTALIADTLTSQRWCSDAMDGARLLCSSGCSGCDVMARTGSSRGRFPPTAAVVRWSQTLPPR